MKPFKIKLRRDSRDLIKQFGQAISFPAQFDAKTPIQDVVQPVGNSECTCITTCDIAGDQDNTVYDYDNLFNRIPHTSQGAEPRQALGEAVKNGLLPKGLTDLVKHWSSYWKISPVNTDMFDAIRSALMETEYPVALATPWFANWSYLTILPVGQSISSYHMYVAEGWTQMNGEPMLIIEAWLGYKLYMNRTTFNDAISRMGCGAWVLSTEVIDAKRKRTIIQYILDNLANVVLLIQRELNLIMRQ